MTAREMIKALQELGEDNLDRELIMFDSAAHYTPYKVEILGSEWSKAIQGKILID